jgi:hypothetical protein
LTLWISVGLAQHAPDPNAAERSAIERAVADYKDVDHLLAPDRGPWSEITAPKLSAGSIEFVTPEVAIVDAVSTEFGTTIGVVKTPVLVVMRKQQGAWRVATLGRLSPYSSQRQIRVRP